MVPSIPGYRLLQKLGAGAAGEVWLATPMEDKAFAAAGDPVAVKVYKASILELAHQLDRIQREFRVGREITHPNLLSIYESSLREGAAEPSQGETPFLVMEYVDGVSLEDWLRMYGRMPIRLVSSIVRQLLEGLKELHSRDIIHRDLKPSNVMLSSTFEAKLMDFGVVRIRSDEALTPEERFLGSIRSAAPEMLFGNRDDYDYRADLYSLGSILYALLHGEEPFAEERQFARLVSRRANEDPEFDVSIDRHGAAEARLVRLARGLLARNPDERPTIDEAITEVVDTAALISAKEDPEPKYAYIATALTGLSDDAREAIMFASGKIAEVAKEYGVYVYQPRKASDPLLHTDIAPETVYRMDRRRVTKADLLIAILNHTSFGVGIELAIAGSFGTPTLLLARSGCTVSRMVVGSPLNLLSDGVLEYDTPEVLERKLRRVLTESADRIAEWREQRQRPRGLTVGQRLQEYRRARGYVSELEFARRVGVSARVIEGLERGEFEFLDVGVLTRACQVLGVSITDLLAGDGAMVPISTDSDPNLQRLELIAGQLGWSTTDFLELRSDYLRELAATGGGARGSVSEESWEKRHSALHQRKLRDRQGKSPATRIQGSLGLDSNDDEEGE